MLLDYLLIYTAISLFTALLMYINEDFDMQITGEKTIGQTIVVYVVFLPTMIIFGSALYVIAGIEFVVIGLWKILGKLGKRK